MPELVVITGVDAGQLSSEPFLYREIHLPANLNPLRLRGTCSVKGFREVADGVSAHRHVLDQPKDANACFGWNVGTAFQVLFEKRA